MPACAAYVARVLAEMLAATHDAAVPDITGRGLSPPDPLPYRFHLAA